MKVCDCMCSDIVTVKPDATVSDVAKKMQETHVGCLPVCDEQNKLVGLVTDRDLTLRCIACDKDYKTTPVSEVMTTNIFTVRPDDNINDATRYMCDCQVNRIPVVENGCIKGIITIGDLAKNSEMSSNYVGKAKQDICCGKHNKE